MGFPEVASFAPLGTIHPPSSSLLLPGACNPVMDLVAIPTAATQSRAQATSDAKRDVKGKGKGPAAEARAVGLWRMSGAKVWEVPVDGDLAGLAWSIDGLHLSLLTYTSDGSNTGSSAYRIQHLSVHDGAVVHSASITENGRDLGSHTYPPGSSTSDTWRWWDMEWFPVDIAWPIAMRGSSRMVVDLLPKVTPVEDPKPTNPLLLMMMQNANKTKPKTPSRHTKLSHFPSLLPSHSTTRPQILRLTAPHSQADSHRHHELLTGTFDLIEGIQTDKLLVLGDIANRLYGLNDVVLRGVDNTEQSFKEGGKQTMIWREELETCGEQQGMTIKDVHADLFKFLMTGRSGPAVQEWLGNRLTGRVLTKWSDTLETSLKDISKVIMESIQPALERIVLLLDDLKGLIESLDDDEKHMVALIQARDKARGMIVLLERVRHTAKLQLQAGREWFSWLQYEIARATSTDPSQDNLPFAQYDLKLVWLFAKSGFVDPPLARHFPGQVEELPLQPQHFTKLPPKTINLDQTLKDTLAKLSNTSNVFSPELVSPRQEDVLDNSQDTSMAMSLTSNLTPTKARPESPDNDEDDLSEGTVERKTISASEPVRQPELEAMTWAREIVESCQSIYRTLKENQQAKIDSFKQARTQSASLDPGGQSLFAKRAVGENTWFALAPKSAKTSQSIWLGFYHDTDDLQISLQGFELSGECLSLEFFDDEELALVLSAPGSGETYLATVRFIDLIDELNPQSLEKAKATLASITGAKSPTATGALLNNLVELPIAQSRPLVVPRNVSSASLALNGRQGRRVACVATGDGHEIQVFDMEGDEDGEDEEDEDEGDAEMEE